MIGDSSIAPEDIEKQNKENDMKTTFGEIRSFNPCDDGWKKLCKNLNPEMNMEKEVSILEVLKSNGVKAAFWALRTQEYKDYCLILADVAESVLYIFEEKRPQDSHPRNAIEEARKWYVGEIKDEELKELYLVTCDVVAYAAAAHAAYAASADAASATHAASAVAAYAASAHATSAAYADGAYADGADAAYADGASEEQWDINEAILRKHLLEGE